MLKNAAQLTNVHALPAHESWSRSKLTNAFALDAPTLHHLLATLPHVDIGPETCALLPRALVCWSILPPVASSALLRLSFSLLTWYIPYPAMFTLITISPPILYQTII